MHRNSFRLARYWNAWRALRPPSFVPGGPIPDFGWGAIAKNTAIRKGAFSWNALWAVTQRAGMLLGALIHICIDYDRQLFLESRAQDAQRAASQKDWRGLYGIVRSLGGLGSSSAPHPVRRVDGTLTTSEQERQERWQEHFHNVFNGNIVTMDQLRALPHAAPLPPSWKMHVEDTKDAWRHLGRNKGVGKDGLPAEFLQATAEVTAPIVTDIYNEVIVHERWPVRWTGGRLQDIFKNKGHRDQCDDSRGIILEDHMAKGIKQHLSYDVAPCYQLHMPDSQHGAVCGRSTDFATHLVREALAYATIAKLSIFILFIDLVKAFDRIIREITLGWPAGVNDARTYLRSLGLSAAQAEWIAAFVSVHGCLFEQWGVDPKVTRLLKNMHVQSWFSYGDLDNAVATRVGGRQGCKFGATLFNSTFSVALIMIRDVLMAANVTARLHCDHAAPWTSAAPSSCSPTEDVLDAAFVDDTVLILIAASPKLLDLAIDILLTNVQEFYTALNLEINWAPGKTEAMLQYRGKGAAARMNARRPVAGAKPVITVPVNGMQLQIVDLYKHLGGEITVSGSLMPLATSRRKRALAAYAPLAMKVFGSPHLTLDLKQWMFQTLVLSRLLFNLHVVVPSRRMLTILNDVYLRGHRRMHDTCRFGPGGESDRTFRERTERASPTWDAS
jgi:hypothetical protein